MNEPSRNQFANFTRSQSVILLILTLLLVAISFTMGYFTRQLVDLRLGKFALLEEAYQIFEDHAYGPLPDQNKLVHGMIRGMLQAYGDPYTSLVEPAQAKLQTNQLEGKFGGIGVRLDRDKQNNILLYPNPNSPAQKAGLVDADRLVGIDQLVVQSETSMDEVQSAIRGSVGSTVKLAIARSPDFKPFIVQIRREEVASPSVTSNLVPDYPEIGIIQVNVIAATSPDEILKAQTSLKSRGAKAFILDLRNDGGGLVDAGIDSARLFLPKGSPVIDQQFRGEAVQSSQADQDGPLAGIPLIVLVNQNTASAAEILAGSLQAQKRALLVGNKTFGKDAVQLVFDLQDRSSLHITSGKWWLPGQEGALAGKGLKPDILLNDGDANSGAAIQAAVKALGY